MTAASASSCIDRAGLRQRQAEGRADDLGRLLRHQEVSRQARPAQGPAATTSRFALMADGVKPADVYKVLATDGRRRPRLQEARHHQDDISLVGSRRAAAAVAGRRRRGDDHATTAASTPRTRTRSKNFKMVMGRRRSTTLDFWVIPKGTPNKDARLQVHRLRRQAGEPGEAVEEHRLRYPNKDATARSQPGAEGPADRAGQHQERAARSTSLLGSTTSTS